MIKALLWTFGILGAILGVLYVGVFDVWTIPQDDEQLNVALQPTLNGGDVVVVSRHTVPELPSLARCADPDAPGRWVVGRIVGNPGDVVTIEGDVVRVPGRRSPSPRACIPPKTAMKSPVSGEDMELDCHQEEYGGTTFSAFRRSDSPSAKFTTTVETGRVFLASDNRHLHLDSRDFGQVDPATCQRILVRLWSAAGPGDSDHRFTFMF